MNWAENNISTTPFLPSKHDSLGKKSNVYNIFVCVAFQCYNIMRLEEKESVIESIMGMRMYKNDVRLKVLVNKQWSKMDQELKETWQGRAIKLNKQFAPGQFVNVPSSISDPSGFIYYCLCQETVYLGKTFRASLTIRKKKNLLKMFIFHWH